PKYKKSGGGDKRIRPGSFLLFHGGGGRLGGLRQSGEVGEGSGSIGKNGDVSYCAGRPGFCRPLRLV
ncbi:hypothetical protein, partial [Eisenbergiella porci]|uniref:hypothetical protein n=1 Tax=Eisenbergiella porci TaxID=2652274 RepID=UPI0022E67C0C